MPHYCNKEESLETELEAYLLLSGIVCYPGYSPVSH
jgi:hypothetical protein